MNRGDFKNHQFVDMFFHDLDRYLKQLRPAPGRVVALDKRDRRRLARSKRRHDAPDFSSYKGLRLQWIEVEE